MPGIQSKDKRSPCLKVRGLFGLLTHVSGCPWLHFLFFGVPLRGHLYIVVLLKPQNVTDLSPHSAYSKDTQILVLIVLFGNKVVLITHLIQ